MIVVTTPTGQIGQLVLQHLVDAGAPTRVIVRDATKLPAALHGSVEVVEGSHGDPEVIDEALDGAEALFWVAPPDPARTLEETYLEFTRPAAEAIRRHEVKRVVDVTALGRGTRWQDGAGLVTASIRMDDLLMSTGANFRGLAMPSFMDNMSRQIASIEEKGVISGPIDPDRKVPVTAVRDLAALAAALLADDGWSGRREVPVLGPEDLSGNDMAAILSQVLAREIRYQQISFERLKQQFLGRGASESFASGYVEMVRAKNEGMDNAADLGLAKRGLTTFREWCETHLEPASPA